MENIFVIRIGRLGNVGNVYLFRRGISLRAHSHPCCATSTSVSGKRQSLTLRVGKMQFVASLSDKLRRCLKTGHSGGRSANSGKRCCVIYGCRPTGLSHLPARRDIALAGTWAHLRSRRVRRPSMRLWLDQQADKFAAAQNVCLLAVSIISISISI